MVCLADCYYSCMFKSEQTCLGFYIVKCISLITTWLTTNYSNDWCAIWNYWLSCAAWTQRALNVNSLFQCFLARLLRACVAPEHSSHMRGREHLDLKPKEKLRGRGDGQATRVPRPHLRSLTGKRLRRHRGRPHTAVLAWRGVPPLPLHECADQDCKSGGKKKKRLHPDKDIRTGGYSDCIIQRWREGQSEAPLFLQSEQNCWGTQTLFMVQSPGK